MLWLTLASTHYVKRNGPFAVLSSCCPAITEEDRQCLSLTQVATKGPTSNF